MAKADLENAFALWLNQRPNRDLPRPERQYKFHPKRKWRFDFAWPAQKVAVEIDGLVYGGRGGHQTVDGVVKDCEKYEAAHLLGWRVYRVPGPWIAEGSRLIWRPETMTTLRVLLTGTPVPRKENHAQTA